jgi:hypothetical protein
MTRTALSISLLIAFWLTLTSCSEKASGNKAEAVATRTENQLTLEEKLAETNQKIMDGNSKSQLNLQMLYNKDKDEFINENTKIVLAQEMATPNNAGSLWVKIGTSNDGTVTIYANPSTLYKNGNMVRIWWLIDLKEAQQVGNAKSYLSMTLHYEFACEEAKSRTLALYSFSENMGRGEIVNKENFEFQDWDAVPPDSIYEIVRKFSCGRK